MCLCVCECVRFLSCHGLSFAFPTCTKWKKEKKLVCLASFHSALVLSNVRTQSLGYVIKYIESTLLLMAVLIHFYGSAMNLSVYIVATTYYQFTIQTQQTRLQRNFQLFFWNSNLKLGMIGFWLIPIAFVRIEIQNYHREKIIIYMVVEVHFICSKLHFYFTTGLPMSNWTIMAIAMRSVIFASKMILQIDQNQRVGLDFVVVVASNNSLDSFAQTLKQNTIEKANFVIVMDRKFAIQISCFLMESTKWLFYIVTTHSINQIVSVEPDRSVNEFESHKHRRTSRKYCYCC